MPKLTKITKDVASGMTNAKAIGGAIAGTLAVVGILYAINKGFLGNTVKNTVSDVRGQAGI